MCYDYICIMASYIARVKVIAECLQIPLAWNQSITNGYIIMNIELIVVCVISLTNQS